MAKSVTLKEWIERNDIKEIAYALRVDAASVRHWRRGVCLPRPEQMRVINKISRGAVSYESMIESKPLSKKFSGLKVESLNLV